MTVKRPHERQNGRTQGPTFPVTRGSVGACSVSLEERVGLGAAASTAAFGWWSSSNVSHKRKPLERSKKMKEQEQEGPAIFE